MPSCATPVLEFISLNSCAAVPKGPTNLCVEFGEVLPKSLCSEYVTYGHAKLIEAPSGKIVPCAPRPACRISTQALHDAVCQDFGAACAVSSCCPGPLRQRTSEAPATHVTGAYTCSICCYSFCVASSRTSKVPRRSAVAKPAEVIYIFRRPSLPRKASIGREAVRLAPRSGPDADNDI